LQNVVTAFTGIQPLNLMPDKNRADLLMPAESVGPSTSITGKKMEGNEIAVPPFFNIMLNQVAARLSDIELTLDCYDVSNLELSTHALKDLFITMNMQTACRYTGRMEEMMKKYKLREAGQWLLEVKKMVAQIMRNSQSLTD
jgi:hypothetical protein